MTKKNVTEEHVSTWNVTEEHVSRYKNKPLDKIIKKKNTYILSCETIRSLMRFCEYKIDIMSQSI